MARPRNPRPHRSPAHCTPGRHAARRRGVILLVILTILVLFTLVAVTFVLVATQEYKTARADWKAQLYDDEHDELLERIVLQVIRGADNPVSRVGFHSLLEDMYGSDGTVDFLRSTADLDGSPGGPYNDAIDSFGETYGLGGGSLMFFDVPLVGPDGANGAAGVDDDVDTPVPVIDEIDELGYGDDYKLMNGYYNGRVITMVDGPMAGRSTRIVGYLVNLTGSDMTFPSTDPVLPPLPSLCARLLMQPFEGMVYTGAGWDMTYAPDARDVFVINGLPYNGTGAGFNWATPVDDPEAGRVDALDTLGRPWALLPFPAKFPGDLSAPDPHYVAYMEHLCGPDAAPGYLGVDDDGNGITDFVAADVPDMGELWAAGSDDLRQMAFDEDYDAVDYQNMLMAARIWNEPDGRWDVVLPSLVRPDLVRYWVAQYAAAGGAAYNLTNPAVVAELFSRIYPRPLQIGPEADGYGHPDFDGNPMLSLEDLTDADGDGVPESMLRFFTDFDGDGFPDVVYDVDNDGDGRPDSVWVDIGLPVQTMADGRIVKPLAAILVLDMDGRLNINAHGMNWHFAYDGTSGEYYIAQNTFDGPYAYAAGGGTNESLFRPIGGGASVGEVNLRFGLPDPYLGTYPDYQAAFGTGNTINEYRQLLHGRPPLDLDGDGTADVPAIPGRYGEEYLYHIDGEFLEPIGGNATTDWIDRYIAAGGQLPMPGISSTGALPEIAGTFPGAPGGWGWDDTEDTADDLYDGDDNRPAAVGSGVGGAFVNLWSGNYYADGFLAGAFGAFRIGASGSPGDLDGNGGLYLDLRGQPYFSQMGDINLLSGITLPEGVDEHAELDLSRQAMRQAPMPSGAGYPFGTRQQIDQPFTPGELEYLLRYFDLDARSLPNRIGRLAPATVADNLARGRLTSDSWDSTTPAITPTPELRELFGPAANNLTIHDLLAARLIAGLGLTIPLTLDQGIDINEQMVGGWYDIDADGTLEYVPGLLSPDLASGLRLDLNRPLGNGLDDDNDGVVDDPDEAINIDSDNDGTPDYTDPAALFAAATAPALEEKLERLWIGSAAEDASPEGMLPFDNNNDGLYDYNDMQVRQDLARRLYVLMMLLKDSGFHHPAFESGLSGPSLRSPFVDPATGKRYPFGNPAVPPTEAEELSARRIAQWCINVVDFRDRDSIMTPFEYDIRPFEDGGRYVDGVLEYDDYPWDVDGWVGQSPFTGTSDDDEVGANRNPHRRMVWGCEQPDLLLMETIAFHDRRVEDLDNDNNPNGGEKAGPDPDDDDDFDQQRIPQGSAFIELYCCRNPGNPAVMGDLYLADGRLDLGKIAPEDDDGDAYPVWRLAISESPLPIGIGGDPDNPENDVFNRLYGTLPLPPGVEFAPDTTTLQPERMNLFDPADDIAIERIVWFAPYAPTNFSSDGAKTTENNKVYYNRATPGSVVPLPPGSYAVVGPRREIAGGGSNENVTVIGFEAAGDPEPQRIRLGNSDPYVPFLYDAGEVVEVPTDYPGYPTDGASDFPDIKTPLGIAVAGDRTGWTEGVGLSISEPIFSGAYYPVPNGPTNTTDPHDGTIWDDLYDADPATAGVQSHDEPFDNVAGRPLQEDGILETGTTTNYKTVFLQRLANPVWPWNPEVGQPGHEATLPVNPYITVDWMPIDLTVFNGQYDSDDQDPMDPDQDPYFDPDDPTPDANAASGEVSFASRQRGEDDETDNVVPNSPRRGTTASTFNLWSPISAVPPAVNDAASYRGEVLPGPYAEEDLHNFGYLLDHTLGYLNLPYQDTAADPIDRWHGNPDPYGDDDLWEPAVDRHTGDPVLPFSWLTWNNRPYASAMELLLVPSSSPQRLLYEHDIRRTDFEEHYTEKTSSGNQIADDGPPYNHLLHLLLSSDTDDETTGAYNPADPDEAMSNFHRLFELVTVPSRMSGTEEMLDPVAFTPFTAAVGANFHPPFNRLSRYRDPGRINLNTIFDDGAILRGLTNDIGNSDDSNDELWAKFNVSRRGYSVGAATDQIPRYHLSAGGTVESPTIFANPFRSFGGDYNVPLDALRYREVDSSGSGTHRQYVESGLLRPDPDDDNRPLFAPSARLGDTVDWTDADWTEAYRNANRNPYFRYQLLQKLGNSVTTRSHVYAIWITVGFFEAERITPSAQHPEGFRFGREAGSDTGEIRRHRGFYLFDRSIPVAFERGRTHNVHRGLLIERVIE